MAMQHLLIYLLKANKHSADEKGIFYLLDWGGEKNDTD